MGLMYIFKLPIILLTIIAGLHPNRGRTVHVEPPSIVRDTDFEHIPIALCERVSRSKLLSSTACDDAPDPYSLSVPKPWRCVRP